MPDNPQKEDNRDRSRVSGSEDYVRYFADQNGISMEQARELTAAMGPSAPFRAAANVQILERCRGPLLEHACSTEGCWRPAAGGG